MPRPIRIIAGGIMHETNSFTPVADAVVERVTGAPTERAATTAVVRVGGVRLILTGERQSFTDRAAIAAVETQKAPCRSSP